jgi:DNA polymerase I-like protein with 3'-5' exonuclease and polymerase domains
MRNMHRTICWTPKELKECVEFMNEAVLIANDIETIPFRKKKQTKEQKAQGIKPPLSPHLMTVNAFSGVLKSGEVGSYALPFLNGKSPTSGVPYHFEEIYETSRKVNNLPTPKTYQNGVYDCAWLLYYGLPVKNYAYDTMSMWWSLYPDLPRRLDFISSILLDDYQYWKGDRKDDDFNNYMNYAMSDTESTLRNTMKLITMLEDNERARVNFFFAHMRCLSGLGMSAKGIAVDESIMDQISASLDKEAEKALESLRYLVADPEFNPNSPAQKKHLIYTILGAKKRNAKGRPAKRIEDASTGAIQLRAMRSEHPIFRRVADALLNAQSPAKQISNVVGIARFPAGSTGSRFLTSYDGVGTTTTRYASRGHAFGYGGNAQNIRKKFRRFGRAEEGHFFFEADYSAADDVFVAYESQEQKKIDLVLSGLDGHAVNATIFFPNWTYESIVAGKKADDPLIVHPITGIRQITKKVVHGTHYLMAALTMFNNAGREAIVAAAIQGGFPDAGRWPQAKLVDYCAFMGSRFREHYPRFRLETDSSDSWYLDLRREVVRTGGFLTPFRYFQRFSSDPNDDSTLRAVAATAGQAGTAGRINTVLDEIVHGYIPKYFRDGENPNYGDTPRLIGEQKNGVSVRQQTHDSMGFDINPMRRGWLKGLQGVLDSFNRPVLIYGREVRVGVEWDASINWAGKGITSKSTNAEDVIPFLEANEIRYLDS